MRGQRVISVAMINKCVIQNVSYSAMGQPAKKILALLLPRHVAF